MESNATTMFISVKPSDLKKSTVEELRQDEKDKLFDKADQLLSTPQSLITESTESTREEMEYEEAVSEAEKDSQDLPDSFIGTGDDFTGDTVAPDEDSQEVVDKAQSMADAQVVTDDTENASDLFAIADELLDETTKASVHVTCHPCSNFTAPRSNFSLPSKKTEDTTCEIVTEPLTKSNVLTTAKLLVKAHLLIKTNLSARANPSTNANPSTQVSVITKETIQTGRPKRQKSTHMWQQFNWDWAREKKEVTPETIKTSAETTELFDTTCELCNEINNSTSTPTASSKSQMPEQIHVSTDLKSEVSKNIHSESLTETTTQSLESSSDELEHSTQATSEASENYSFTDSEHSSGITIEISRTSATSESLTKISTVAAENTSAHFSNNESEDHSKILSDETEISRTVSTESADYTEVITEVSIEVSKKTSTQSSTKSSTEIASETTETLKEFLTESSLTEISTESSEKVSTQLIGSADFSNTESEDYREILSDETKISKTISTELADYTEVITEISTKVSEKASTQSSTKSNTEIASETTETLKEFLTESSLTEISTESSEKVSTQLIGSADFSNTESEDYSEILSDETEISKTVSTESADYTEVITEISIEVSKKTSTQGSTKSSTEIASETTETPKEFLTESSLTEISTESSEKVSTQFIGSADFSNTESEDYNEILSDETKISKTISTESADYTEVITEISTKVSEKASTQSSTKSNTEIASKTTETTKEFLTESSLTEISTEFSEKVSTQFIGSADFSNTESEEYNEILSDDTKISKTVSAESADYTKVITEISTNLSEKASTQASTETTSETTEIRKESESNRTKIWTESSEKVSTQFVGSAKTETSETYSTESSPTEIVTEASFTQLKYVTDSYAKSSINLTTEAENSAVIGSKPTETSEEVATEVDSNSYSAESGTLTKISTETSGKAQHSTDMTGESSPDFNTESENDTEILSEASDASIQRESSIEVFTKSSISITETVSKAMEITEMALTESTEFGEITTELASSYPAVPKSLTEISAEASQTASNLFFNKSSSYSTTESKSLMEIMCEASETSSEHYIKSGYTKITTGFLEDTTPTTVEVFTNSLAETKAEDLLRRSSNEPRVLSHESQKTSTSSSSEIREKNLIDNFSTPLVHVSDIQTSTNGEITKNLQFSSIRSKTTEKSEEDEECESNEESYDEETTQENGDNETYTQIYNNISDKNISKKVEKNITSIEGTKVMEHLNGLAIIPKTKKMIDNMRTGHHFTRVTEEHTVYNDDDEVVGVTNISRLVYKSGTVDATESMPITNLPFDGSLPCELCENEKDADDKSTTVKYESKISEVSTELGKTESIPEGTLEISTEESSKAEASSNTGSTLQISKQTSTESAVLASENDLSPTQSTQTPSEKEISSSLLLSESSSVVNKAGSKTLIEETSSYLITTVQIPRQTETVVAVVAVVASGHALLSTQSVTPSAVQEISKELSSSLLLSEASSSAHETISKNLMEGSSSNIASTLQSSKQTGTETTLEASSHDLLTANSTSTTKSEMTLAASKHDLLPTQPGNPSSSVKELPKKSTLSTSTPTSSVNEAVPTISMRGTSQQSSTTSAIILSSKPSFFAHETENKPLMEGTSSNVASTLQSSKQTGTETTLEASGHDFLRVKFTTPAKTEMALVGSNHDLLLTQPGNTFSSAKGLSKESTLLTSTPTSLVNDAVTTISTTGTSQQSNTTSAYLKDIPNNVLSNISNETHSKTTLPEYYDEESSEISKEYTGTIHYTRVFEVVPILDEDEYVVAVQNISHILYADKNRRRNTSRESMNVTYEFNRDNLIEGTDETQETWAATENSVQNDGTKQALSIPLPPAETTREAVITRNSDISPITTINKVTNGSATEPSPAAKSKFPFESTSNKIAASKTTVPGIISTVKNIVSPSERSGLANAFSSSTNIITKATQLPSVEPEIMQGTIVKNTESESPLELTGSKVAASRITIPGIISTVKNIVSPSEPSGVTNGFSSSTNIITESTELSSIKPEIIKGTIVKNTESESPLELTGSKVAGSKTTFPGIVSTVKKIVSPSEPSGMANVFSSSTIIITEATELPSVVPETITDTIVKNAEPLSESSATSSFMENVLPSSTNINTDAASSINTTELLPKSVTSEATTSTIMKNTVSISESYGASSLMENLLPSYLNIISESTTDSRTTPTDVARSVKSTKLESESVTSGPTTSSLKKSILLSTDSTSVLRESSGTNTSEIISSKAQDLEADSSSEGAILGSLPCELCDGEKDSEATLTTI